MITIYYFLDVLYIFHGKYKKKFLAEVKGTREIAIDDDGEWWMKQFLFVNRELSPTNSITYCEISKGGGGELLMRLLWFLSGQFVHITDGPYELKRNSSYVEQRSI